MAYEYTTQGYTVIDAGRRVVVDPVTRIEGHLRCEVNLDEQNVITNAVSCGTIFRGIEIILKGRDPRDAWAFVERICGVCTGTHALASVHAVENALGIDVPDNACMYPFMVPIQMYPCLSTFTVYTLFSRSWLLLTVYCLICPFE